MNEERAATAPTVSHMLGEMTWLLTQSPLHRALTLGDLEWLVMPALLAEQFYVFRDGERPIGLALWARTTAEGEAKLERGMVEPTNRLTLDEWQNGDRVWLIDLVAPFATAENQHREVMMADLITGRLDFGWPTLSTSRAYLADKKLRAVALDADARWPMLPDVPTLTELGFGKEKVASWFALAAPAGTPPAVVTHLREMFVKASQDPELKRKLDENGTPIVTSTPAEMGKAMETEWAVMQELAKVLNLRPQ